MKTIPKSAVLLCCALATVCGALQPAMAAEELEKVDGRRVVPGRLLVRLAGADENAGAAALRGQGLAAGRKLALARAEVWHLPQGVSVDAAIRVVRLMRGVEAVEPDFIRTVSLVPNDPSYGQQYALPKMHVPEAWDITTGSASVIVAIVDSGMQYTHPDLAANVYMNPNETVDGIDNDGNGYVDDIRGWDFVGASLKKPKPDNNVADTLGHGTRVAGVIGAVGNNSLGVTGLNWNVRLMPLKVGADTTALDLSNAAILEAYDYARNNGARVINASFSGPEYSHFEADALQALHDAGIILCAAAGNKTQSLETTPSYPASLNFPNIISVAATDSSELLASYSNYGSRSVDLGAPGSAIYTTSMTNTYASVYGTSFSAPQMAGIVALMRARYPSLGVRDLRLMILEGTDPVASLAGKTVTGGRANVLKALTAAVPFSKRYQQVLTPRRSIPDNNPTGINQIVTVEESLPVRGVSVHVHTDHPWLGDLQLKLTSPTGIENTLLKSRIDANSGFSWDFETQFDYRGRPSLGDWRLNVADLGPGDLGYLVDWTLEIHYNVPEDVNSDGVVNVLDLILTRNAIGQTSGICDVNGDGAVNVLDLIRIRNLLGLQE